MGSDAIAGIEQMSDNARIMGLYEDGRHVRARAWAARWRERMRERMKRDPEEAERQRAMRRAAAARRMEELRADPSALQAYRERRRRNHEPEKRRASQRAADARRRERISLDPEYRARILEWRRADNARRQDRLRLDAEYHRRYRQQQKEWYWRNRSRLIAQRRTREAQRVEAINARERRRYAEDPGRVLRYYRGWKARNPERARAYQRAADHRRRNAEGSFTFAEWLELLERHGRVCAYCGASGEMEADHRLPISRGGSNKIDNILPACRPCNRSKHSLTDQEFRARRQQGSSGRPV